MRMLRWLMLHDGPTTQAEFMREYRRAGATKGSSFLDHFSHYTRARDVANASTKRVIVLTPIEPTPKSELHWGGPDVDAWLAATPDRELQQGFEAMERAWIATTDDHYRDW